MCNFTIWAGVVVFNPQKERLLSNISSIKGQVAQVVVYNNGGLEEELAVKLVESGCNIIGNGVNKGIASALEEIMIEAYEGGADWVITMDQDSLLPNSFMTKAMSHMQCDEIGVICPQAIDKRRVYMLDRVNKVDDVYVKMCITSASCIRLKAWEEIGGFDESLFIDLVDNDFCKRLTINGWKILKMNSVVLDQEYGEIYLRNRIIVNFLERFSKKIRNRNLSVNIAKLSYKKVVSPMRVYYTNRNILYLNKKYLNYGGIGYEVYNCKSYFGFSIVFNLASFLRGKNKGKIIGSIIKGIRDGRRMAAAVTPYNATQREDT